MTGANFPPASAVRAFLHAGGVTTEYRRAGRGATAVLLVEPEWTETLLSRLAAAFRVLVPEVPAPRPTDTDPSGRLAFCLWLRAFFDGLGVERASLVAGAAHGAGALAFALLEEDLVDRLVLLDAPGSGALAAADPAARTSLPLLSLHAEAGSADAADAACRFLAGD